MLCPFLAPTSGPRISSSHSAFVQDAHCRSWPGLNAVKKSRSHRAWLSEDMRRMKNNLEESHVPVGQLPAFEGAGADVAREFLQGEKIDDEVSWKREEKFDFLAQELVELHGQLQEALEMSNELPIAQGENIRVEHLGHGVYVQYGVQAIDTHGLEGKTATITREESRGCVRHALDALQNRFRVAVTGHPGIGKTRGSMMYAIQTLLYHRSAVLYVGYKSREMLLFLPREDGTYRVWSASSDQFGLTVLSRDNRVVAVIDPPERSSYIDDAKCRVLKFVSNNAEKHFRNWEKDGILLVTLMPTDREVLAMTQVLWDEYKTPLPHQLDTFRTMEEKQAEVEKRIELVGAIPRLIFNSNLFAKDVARCLQGAEEAAREVSESDLYKAMIGRYTPFLEKHPASTSSRLFLVGKDTVSVKTWRERTRYRPAIQLTPVAILLLCDLLEERVTALRKENFEQFAFDWLCMREGRQADVQRREKYLSDAAYQRIAYLRRDELRVYRPAAKNFAFVDFVSSVTTWYNAKSTSENAKAVYIKEDGAQQFLTRLENVMKETFSDDEISKIMEEEVSLTAITNSSAQPKMGNPEKSLRLFSVPVAFKVINLTDEMAVQPLKEQIDRTRMLLEELNVEF